MSHYDDWADDYLSEVGSDIAYAAGIWSFGAAMKHTPESLRALGMSEEDIKSFNEILQPNWDKWEKHPPEVIEKIIQKQKESMEAKQAACKKHQNFGNDIYVEFGGIEVDEDSFQGKRSVYITLDVQWPLSFPNGLTSATLRELISEYMQASLASLRSDLEHDILVDGPAQFAKKKSDLAVGCPAPNYDPMYGELRSDHQVKGCCKMKSESTRTDPFGLKEK